MAALSVAAPVPDRSTGRRHFNSPKAQLARRRARSPICIGTGGLAPRWSAGCRTGASCAARRACLTPGAAVRVVPGRLPLLCLPLRSSWLTVEGGRGRRRRSAASPGRTGRRGRVGSVAVGVPKRKCQSARCGRTRLPNLRDCGSDGTSVAARQTAQEQVRDRRCWIAAREAANGPLRQTTSSSVSGACPRAVRHGRFTIETKGVTERVLCGA